jgi:hypothetical protein
VTGMNKKTDISKILETFILAAIVLVIIQTFLDEYSRYAHWSVRSRNILLITGFCFDLIFSIEFTVRSFYNNKKGAFLNYIRYERGWVDFISSFPLLLLDSGPSLFFLITVDAHSGAGVIGAMNVLKVVKAVRITRILRLVRVIKIFGKIHNAESKMAQHHTATITATAVFTVVSVLLLFTLIFGTSASHFSKERSAEYINLIDGLKRISDMNGLGFRESSEGLLLSDKNILKIIYSNGTVIERIAGTEFARYYDEEDYISVTGKGCTLLVSIIDINREIALEHIQNFLVIIFIVLSFMVLYTKHFVQNISDVVHILNLGFRKKDYNLLVKIPEEKADHEIFRLAKFYNDSYLPAKMKRMDGDSVKTNKSLSMKDLMDFK